MEGEVGGEGGDHPRGEESRPVRGEGRQGEEGGGRRRRGEEEGGEGEGGGEEEEEETRQDSWDLTRLPPPPVRRTGTIFIRNFYFKKSDFYFLTIRVFYWNEREARADFYL